MARYENADCVTLMAGEAIGIAKFVAVSAANTVTMADSATAAVIGVSAEGVASGESLPVALGGVVMIQLGATLSAGDEVECSTDGVAVAASGAGDFSCGTLLEGGDSGEIVPMVLNIQRLHA